MADTVTLTNTEAVADQYASDSATLSKSERQSRFPEGRFKLFVMDFDLPGTSAKEYYPAILKPLGSGRTKAVRYSADDYLPFRFAVGRARKYILDTFGITYFEDLDTASAAFNVNFLKETYYYRLKKNGGTASSLSTNPYADWDPESKGVVIKNGHHFSVQQAGYIEQTGINAQNTPIKGPVRMRVPTIVTAFHFAAWLQNSPQVTKKSRLEALVLAGGKRVPLGGASQIDSNADG